MSQAFDPFVGKLDPLVEILDAGLGVARHDVGLRAVGLVAQGVLLAEAIEVEISAFGEGERQPVAALPAVQHAFEVVIVATGANTRPVVRGENFLTALEDVAGHQRFVLALILHAVPLDDSDVEGILEHGGERRDRRRRAGLARGR
ncbi:MAG TPA: hypothetical protein VM784_06870 [Actinomycetota bacterium]|nr:hypothetical protein [Actinomycetota bacterium]